MRRDFFAVALLCLASALAATPAAARTFRDPYGSSGGAQVSDECGPGKYFVGVVGATGAWIDQIAVLCAELKSDRTFGPAKTIASRGGTGGGFHPAVICPKNQVVTSMNIAVTKNLQVAHLLLVCTGGNLSPTQLTWGGNGPYDRAVGQACIAGEAGKGLNINYGQYVNGIGIICDTWKVPAAPLVSAQFCKDYAARMFGRAQEARRLNCAFLNEYREFDQTRADYEKYCLSYSVDPVATTSDNERRFQFQLDNCKQPPAAAAAGEPIRLRAAERRRLHQAGRR